MNGVTKTKGEGTLRKEDSHVNCREEVPSSEGWTGAVVPLEKMK